MEYLRWVLLAAGIIFVLFVYLYSRYQRSAGNADVFEDDNRDIEDTAPEIITSDPDGIDQQIDDMRITAREQDDIDDIYAAASGFEHKAAEQETAVLEEVDTDDVAETEQKALQPEVIVLYILAESGAPLSGDSINSVARSNGLTFGDMNIFHYLDEADRSVFSLANMVEPGNFDPSTIHNITTPGLTLFMLPEQVNNPSAAFDDMLQCAWRMSEMLGARLCNQRRQPMTEQDAEHYREIVAGCNGV